MRLYFFPALLPLASLLPPLLAGAGAVAAAFQYFRNRRILAAFLLAMALVALTVAGVRYQRAKILKAGLPQLQRVESLPPLHTRHSWSQLLPRAPLSNLSLSETFGLLLFGTRQGTLDALRIADGTLAFSLQMTEPILSQPLIDRNIVFIGEGLHDATRSRVVALELPSGTPIWQQSFPSHIESALALSADRNIVFGCAGEAGAFALKSSDGSILWRNTLGHCDTTPWIESDTLFLVASSPLQPESSLLWALRASDGSPLWSLPIPGQPWGTPAIDQATSHLVVTSGRGQLDLPIQSGEVGWAHAVDVANRKLRWSRHLDGMPLLNHLLLTLGERSLGVFTLKKGRIIALDLSDGKEIWSLDLKFPILSSPRLLPPQMNAVPEHGLLALDFNGMLYTINGGTGQISSRRPLGTESTSSPAFSSSKVFFGTRGAIFGWSP